MCCGLNIGGGGWSCGCCGRDACCCGGGGCPCCGGLASGWGGGDLRVVKNSEYILVRTLRPCVTALLKSAV